MPDCPSLLFPVQPAAVLAELQLMSRRQSTLVNSTSNISQPFSPGSSSGLEMALMPGRSRVTAANPLEGTGQPIPSQPSTSQQQQQTLQSKMTLSSTPTPICCFRESVSSQATLIYRELYVLPFQCYDKLRKVDYFLFPHCVWIKSGITLRRKSVCPDIKDDRSYLSVSWKLVFMTSYSAHEHKSVL